MTKSGPSILKILRPMACATPRAMSGGCSSNAQLTRSPPSANPEPIFRASPRLTAVGARLAGLTGRFGNNIHQGAGDLLRPLGSAPSAGFRRIPWGGGGSWRTLRSRRRQSATRPAGCGPAASDFDKGSAQEASLRSVVRIRAFFEFMAETGPQAGPSGQRAKGASSQGVRAAEQGKNLKWRVQTCSLCGRWWSELRPA